MILSVANDESKVFEKPTCPSVILTPADLECSNTFKNVGKKVIDDQKIFTRTGRSTLARIEFSGSEHEVGDFKALDQLDTVLVRQIPQYMETLENVPNKYQITKTNGDLLYSVFEYTDKITRRLFRVDQPFKLKVISSYQEYICDLVGDPGIGGLGAYVVIKQNDSLLGKVVQVSPLMSCCNFTPTYNVINSHGKIVYKIDWSRVEITSCMPSDTFQVFNQFKNPVATIKRQKELQVENECFDDDMYHLSFQQFEVGCTDRGLILAAVIMLDFQFFEGNKLKKCSKTTVCAIRMLLILLILGIVITLVILLFVVYM